MAARAHGGAQVRLRGQRAENHNQTTRGTQRLYRIANR